MRLRFARAKAWAWARAWSMGGKRQFMVIVIAMLAKDLGAFQMTPVLAASST